MIRHLALALVAAVSAALVVDAGPQRTTSAPQRDTYGIIALEHARAHDLAMLMMQLEDDLRAVADERTNQLVLKGSHETLAAMKDLAAQLDVEVAGPAAADLFEVIRLEYAHARAVFGTLTPLFDARITTDERTNQLLVSADAETVAAIKDAIAQLDVSVSED